MSTFSIRKKLYLSFTAVILLFLVTTALTTYLSQSNVRLTHNILEAEERLEVVQRLNLFARTANDNGAHYLLAAINLEDEFSERFDASVQFVQDELHRLSGMAASVDNKAQIDNFRTRWIAYVKESQRVFALKKIGRVTEAQEEFTRDSFDPIAFSLHRFYMEQKLQIDAYQDEIERNARTIHYINISMISLALLLSLIIAIRLSGYLTRRIHLLNTSAQQVAGGDLQVADLQFRGRDELTELAQSFNRMTHSLRTVIDSNHFLQHISLLDGLTGIPNRRCYDETLLKEWKQLSDRGQLLTLILLDIDYFKKYNDRYGHQAGDNCLKQVAGLLQREMSEVGLAARYGGEEFAVLLPAIDEQGAAVLAERFRSALAAARIPHEGSEIGAIITVSIGVASVSASSMANPGDLLEQADAALYQAKRTGRNRICIYDPEQAQHAETGKGT